MIFFSCTRPIRLTGVLCNVLLSGPIIKSYQTFHFFMKFTIHTYVSFCISARVRGLCAGRWSWSGGGGGNSPVTWSYCVCVPPKNPKMSPAEYLSLGADRPTLHFGMANNNPVYTHVTDRFGKVIIKSKQIMKTVHWQFTVIPVKPFFIK